MNPNFPVEKTTAQRLLYSPLARITVGVAVCGFAMLAINFILRSLLLSESGIVRSARWLLSASFMLATYCLLFRRYERREITELSTSGAVREGLLGLAAGASSVSAIILVLYLAGYYEVRSTGGPSALWLPLLLFVTLSVFEEVIFRGIIYRVTEESLGTNLALIISGVLFGLAHLPNQYANAVSVLSAASGGVLAGLLFSLTRRLWLPVFFHAGWNWALASFGVAVSGIEDLPSGVESSLEGPELVTGGPFGPENSVITILVVLVLCGVAYYVTWKRGHVVKRARRGKGVTVE